MQAEFRGMEDKRTVGRFYLPFPREAESFSFQFRHAENENYLSFDTIYRVPLSFIHALPLWSVQSRSWPARLARSAVAQRRCRAP